MGKSFKMEKSLTEWLLFNTKQELDNLILVLEFKVIKSIIYILTLDPQRGFPPGLFKVKVLRPHSVLSGE